MDITGDIAKTKELLDKAQNVLIVTHEHPTFDSVGSALALYLGLTSLGKKVTVMCPDPMTVEVSSFVGVEKVVGNLTNKSFVISLDYVDGSIEKVSYNIEGNKFNLVIEPRVGYEGFSEDKVHYSHGGTTADLIFAVDTIHLGGLKKLYEENKDLFATKPVINIDRHPNNAQYGQLNIVDADTSSTIEVVAQMLSSLGVQLTADIATNVLNALYGATNSFQGPRVTAQAFELAAACLKAGGKRFSSPKESEEVSTIKPETVASPIANEVVTPTPKVAETPAAATPPDWLKPKIFKSSNLL